VRELQSLCLDVSIHKVSEDGSNQDTEVDLMTDVNARRIPSRPTYEYHSTSFEDDDD
jgi:DNA-directed RNA polymerase subunit beta